MLESFCENLKLFHRFIGEESASDDGNCELTDSRTWIIDPIDGTTNFVHQNPNICTILAFVENKVTLFSNKWKSRLFLQDVKFGIVYNPITQELWSARKGRGAFYNGEKVVIIKKYLTQEINVSIDFSVWLQRVEEISSYSRVLWFQWGQEWDDAVKHEISHHWS